MLRLPLALYLHDPIAEGTQGLRIHEYAKNVQDTLFAEKHLVFSMSEGLAAMLLKKYGLHTIPLPHCYNESPAEAQPAWRHAATKTALFSGSIYEINRPAIVRAAKTAVRAGYRIVCTSPRAAEIMKADGIAAGSLDVNGPPSRSDYLALLRQQDVLFVALAWPDESTIHRDSLATTFPTKVPEYLGAGRPMLVHCPNDYFLSSFVRDRQCGLLVCERSEERLFEAWMELRDNAEVALRLARNSRNAVTYFDGQRISGIFKQHVETLVDRGLSTVPDKSTPHH
jgi:hypothetical protein